MKFSEMSNDNSKEGDLAVVFSPCRRNWFSLFVFVLIALAMTRTVTLVAELVAAKIHALKAR